jgi:hypothetical protein
MSVAITKMNDARVFDVVHPLDDVAEQKCSPEGLGHMHMSGSVKLSLFALRGYLIVMALLVACRLATLTGVLAHHP